MKSPTNCLKLIMYLLLFVGCFSSMNLFADSPTIKRRILHFGTQLDWYDKYYKDLDRYTGFRLSGPYKEEFISNVRIINGASDTIYVNKQLDGSLLRDIYWSHSGGFQTELLDESEFKRFKWYNPERNLWTIGEETLDGDYRWGRSYNSDKTKFYDIDENQLEYNIMVGIFIAIIICYVIIFPIESCINVCIGLLLSTCIVFFMDTDTLVQLVFPIITIILTSILFKISKYKGKVRVFSQIIIGFSIICFFTYKQFFSLNETIFLIDGTKLDLNWQKGTCLVKRYYVKNMLQNMVPVTISTKNSNGEEYIVYVSKYEACESDVAIVNDEVFSWLSAFFERPLYDFSYRESRFFLELLRNVTGVKFDFLSFEEWSSAACYQKHDPNNGEYNDVDEGIVNKNGLLNITGNMPEYTSSYSLLNSCLSLDADTIEQSYNSVLVAGSAYICEDSLFISVVNKNLREGMVGFRLIYRPNDVATRSFSIVGNLRSDREYINLPKSIELLSIDGQNINDLDNYEAFEEKVIESRFKERLIEFIDVKTHDTIKYLHPKGIEYYDFKPEFTYKYP